MTFAEQKLEEVLQTAADETEQFGGAAADTLAKLAGAGFSLPNLPATIRNILNSRRTFFAA